MRFFKLVPWKHESVGRVSTHEGSLLYTQTKISFNYFIIAMLYKVCDMDSYITWLYQIADHYCRITWVYNKTQDAMENIFVTVL